jgi:hypothetical protein
MSNVTPKQGTVTVKIIDPVTAKEGRQIQARIGASVLDVAQEHDMVCPAMESGCTHLAAPCAPGAPGAIPHLPGHCYLSCPSHLLRAPTLVGFLPPPLLG